MLPKRMKKEGKVPQKVFVSFACTQEACFATYNYRFARNFKNLYHKFIDFQIILFRELPDLTILLVKYQAKKSIDALTTIHIVKTPNI